jgi:hypothetical protein
MRTIVGVSTATAGFLGITEQGPTTPELVTSWSEFQNKFGNYFPQSYLSYSVNGFFTNGGQRSFIRESLNHLTTNQASMILQASVCNH